jgi:hypothetical protein
MPLFRATIEVLLEVDSEEEACDALSEGLRPLLQEFQRPGHAHDSAFVDWRYAEGHPYPASDSGSGFGYEPQRIRYYGE